MTTIRTSCGECRAETSLQPDQVSLITSGGVTTYGWGPCQQCGAHTVRTANTECLSLLASVGKHPTRYIPSPRPELPPLTNNHLIDLVIDLHTRDDLIAELA